MSPTSSNPSGLRKRHNCPKSKKAVKRYRAKRNRKLPKQQDHSPRKLDGNREPSFADELPQEIADLIVDHLGRDGWSGDYPEARSAIDVEARITVNNLMELNEIWEKAAARWVYRRQHWFMSRGWCDRPPMDIFTKDWTPACLRELEVDGVRNYREVSGGFYQDDIRKFIEQVEALTNLRVLKLNGQGTDYVEYTTEGCIDAWEGLLRYHEFEMLEAFEIRSDDLVWRIVDHLSKLAVDHVLDSAVQRTFARLTSFAYRTVHIYGHDLTEGNSPPRTPPLGRLAAQMQNLKSLTIVGKDLSKLSVTDHDATSDSQPTHDEILELPPFGSSLKTLHIANSVIDPDNLRRLLNSNLRTLETITLRMVQILGGSLDWGEVFAAMEAGCDSLYSLDIHSLYDHRYGGSYRWVRRDLFAWQRGFSNVHPAPASWDNLVKLFERVDLNRAGRGLPLQWPQFTASV